MGDVLSFHGFFCSTRLKFQCAEGGDVCRVPGKKWLKVPVFLQDSTRSSRCPPEGVAASSLSRLTAFHLSTRRPSELLHLHFRTPEPGAFPPQARQPVRPALRRRRTPTASVGAGWTPVRATVVARRPGGRGRLHEAFGACLGPGKGRGSGGS